MANHLGLTEKADQRVAKTLILSQASGEALIRSQHFKPYQQIRIQSFEDRLRNVPGIAPAVVALRSFQSSLMANQESTATSNDLARPFLDYRRSQEALWEELRVCSRAARLMDPGWAAFDRNGFSLCAKQAVLRASRSVALRQRRAECHHGTTVKRECEERCPSYQSAAPVASHWLPNRSPHGLTIVISQCFLEIYSMEHTERMVRTCMRRTRPTI